MTALFKLPAYEGPVVWRGITEDLSGLYKQGHEQIWWGLSSCTSDLGVFENNPQFLGKSSTGTLFSIVTRSGRKITAHSYYKKEEEILLLPIYIKVCSQLNPSVGLHIIQVQEQSPPYELFASPFPINSSTPDRPIRISSLDEQHYGTAKNISTISISLDHEHTKSRHRNEKVEDRIAKQRDKANVLFKIMDLNDDDVSIIVDELRCNTKWRELHLFFNKITAVGATHLSQILQSSCLTSLNLNNNSIGDEGVCQISCSLWFNTTLSQLWLNSNSIGNNGANSLAEMLCKNRALQFLKLDLNCIGDDGFKALLDAILL
ncbi:unnamed protein product, partial [Rotaria magnacalcarata]